MAEVLRLRAPKATLAQCDSSVVAVSTPGDFHSGSQLDCGTRCTNGMLTLEVGLPAAAFAEYIDDVGKTLAAVFPVEAESFFQAVCVAGNQGLDDGVVLFGRCRQVVNDGAGVEAPVALGLATLSGKLVSEPIRPGRAQREYAGSSAIGLVTILVGEISSR